MTQFTQAESFQDRAAAWAEANRAANPRKKAALRPSLRENLKYPGSIVFAVVLGLVAVLLSRYVRYHLQGGTLTGEDPDITMMIDGGLAAMAGFAIRQAFRFEAKVFLTAHTVGIGAMIVAMHNLVHVAPGPFSVAFSPEWVQQVMAETSPKSIVFRGMTFGYEDQAPATGDSARICGFDTYMPLSDGEFSQSMQRSHSYCFE